LDLTSHDEKEIPEEVRELLNEFKYEPLGTEHLCYAALFLAHEKEVLQTQIEKQRKLHDCLLIVDVIELFEIAFE